MEKTVSGHPARATTHWAMFLAPVAVTGLVILGALVFVLSTDPDPVDRAPVKTMNLAAMSNDDQARTSSERGSGLDVPSQASGSTDSAPPMATSRTDRHLDSARDMPAIPDPEVDPSVSVEGSDSEEPTDYEYDEDFVDMTSDREYTPEERAEGKRKLRETVRKIGFLGPGIRHLEEQRAREAAGEDGGILEPPSDSIGPNGASEREPSAAVGAAGAAAR